MQNVECRMDSQQPPCVRLPAFVIFSFFSVTNPRPPAQEGVNIRSTHQHNIMKTALILLVASLAIITPVHADPNPMFTARANAAAALATLKNNATTDKGGHRVAAMKHLAAAIAEINAGIAFDRANVSKNEGKKANK